MSQATPHATQVSPPADDTSNRTLSAEESKEELRQAIQGSNQVLATATTVLQLFPDTMTVDRAPAGVPYDCVVRTADGTVATVGSWTTTDAGPASWYVSLDPGLAPVVEVSLVVPGTGTIATARPA